MSLLVQLEGLQGRIQGQCVFVVSWSLFQSGFREKNLLPNVRFEHTFLWSAGVRCGFAFSVETLFS